MKSEELHDKSIPEQRKSSGSDNNSHPGTVKTNRPFFHYKKHQQESQEESRKVKRFRLKIEYDGTEFSGFQRQAFQGKLLVGSNGKPMPAPRTVQVVLCCCP